MEEVPSIPLGSGSPFLLSEGMAPIQAVAPRLLWGSASSYVWALVRPQGVVCGRHASTREFT